MKIYANGSNINLQQYVNKMETMEATVVEVEADLEGLHVKDEEFSTQLGHMTYKNINVLELGMNNEGINSDINTEILNNLATSISGYKVIFPSGVYLIENHWDIREQENFEIEFSKGAILKVKEGTKISHILNLTSCKNFKIVNPTIDGNNIKGLNGLAFNGLSYANYCGDGYVENLTVRNLFRKAVSDEYEWAGGGRALTFQFAVININVDGVNVKNCTAAVDFHGRFEDTDIPHSPVLGIHVNNVFAEDCEEVVSGYSLINGNQQADNPNAVNVRVSNIYARNCGKSTSELCNDSANNDGTDGGVFVFERARFVEIDNATVINDSDYGKIGGLYRGTGQHIKIKNVFCDIDCFSLINSAPARNLMPVVPNNDIITTNLDMRNIYMNGACDYVLIHNANSLNKLYRSKFIDIEVGEVRELILNGIAGSKVGNYLDVKSTISLERIKGDLYDINIRRNSFSDSINIEEVNACKHVFTQSLKVSGYDSIIPIILERGGTNPAIGTIYAYNNNVCIGTESFNHIVKCDTSTRNFEIGAGTWDGGHLVMNNTHIWIDSTGKIRIKNGTPTSDTDGVEVSLQS